MIIQNHCYNSNKLNNNNKSNGNSYDNDLYSNLTFLFHLAFLNFKLFLMSES